MIASHSLNATSGVHCALNRRSRSCRSRPVASWTVELDNKASNMDSVFRDISALSQSTLFKSVAS